MNFNITDIFFRKKFGQLYLKERAKKKIWLGTYFGSVFTILFLSAD